MFFDGVLVFGAPFKSWHVFCDVSYCELNCNCAEKMRGVL